MPKSVLVFKAASVPFVLFKIPNIHTYNAIQSNSHPNQSNKKKTKTNIFQNILMLFFYVTNK